MLFAAAAVAVLALIYRDADRLIDVAVAVALTDDRGRGEAVAARRHVRGAQPHQGQAHRVRRRLGGDQLQRGGVAYG